VSVVFGVLTLLFSGVFSSLQENKNATPKAKVSNFFIFNYFLVGCPNLMNGIGSQLKSERNSDEMLL
jgi:hypothetical protein